MARIVGILVFYFCFLLAPQAYGQKSTPIIDFRDVIADTLSINFPGFPKDYKMKMVEEDGLDHLYVFDCKKGNFEIFDLWTKRHVKTLKPELPAFKAAAFDIVSFNEIYLLGLEGNLIQIDSVGEMVNHWEVHRQMDNANYKISISDRLNNFAVFNQKAYIPIIHTYTKDGTFTLKGKPAMQVFDLEDGEMEDFGGYPKSSYKGSKISNPKYEFATIKLQEENRIVFSYLKDPEIKAYKVKNNRAKSGDARSPFLINSGVRPQKDEFGNIIRYISPNGFYHNLYWDNEKQLYYRTVAHHHDTSPEDRNNGWARRPFSIQIIDRKFNLISEISIPETEPLDHLKISVIKEGILLQICKESQPDVVDFLVLDVYKAFRP
jgi:hypothetical protein